jgi:hypothetical protein
MISEPDSGDQSWLSAEKRHCHGRDDDGTEN